MEVRDITKAATFKTFISYNNAKLRFFVTVFFNIFMRQTLTDDFGGLRKNMNCAFPLRTFCQVPQKSLFLKPCLNIDTF